jgi:hypothetical protein
MKKEKEKEEKSECPFGSLVVAAKLHRNFHL